jgi:hypothetical protein
MALSNSARSLFPDCGRPVDEHSQGFRGVRIFAGRSLTRNRCPFPLTTTSSGGRWAPRVSRTGHAVLRPRIRMIGTRPIPPSPSSAPTRYGPMRVPGSRSTGEPISCANSASTWRRSSASSRQVSARYALRASGACWSARSYTRATCCHRSGVTRSSAWHPCHGHMVETACRDCRKRPDQPPPRLGGPPELQRRRRAGLYFVDTTASGGKLLTTASSESNVSNRVTRRVIESRS